MTTWTWIQFDDKTMPHTVPRYLAAAVVQEMTSRGSAVKERTPRAREFLDLGGMVAVGRPYERFQIAGLTLHVPSEDVTLYVLEVEKAQFRTVGKRRYTKIKRFPGVALCLTERHARQLLRKLKARELVAQYRSDAFYKKWRAANGQ